MMTSSNSRIDGTKKPEQLTDDEKIELVRLIGHHASDEEIGNYLDSIGKRPAQIPRVIHYYTRSEKFRPLIEKFRAEYESRLSDIAVTSKRYRLQRLEQMHEALYREGKYELAAKMLDRVRDEVEGKNADGRPNIFITQFNQLTDTEVEERKLKIINMIERMKKRQVDQIKSAIDYEQLRTPEVLEAQVINE